MPKRKRPDVDSTDGGWTNLHLAEEVSDVQQQRLLFTLPHFSRYNTLRIEELPTSDPRHKIICDQLHRTVTRHRGPARGDPHREPPKFVVKRVNNILNPRLQEKYLVEVQDLVGLCESHCSPCPLDAISVQTFSGKDMNEYLLFHGAPADKIERMQNQGLDPRYAGNHFGAMFGSGSYFAPNSSKSDIYTDVNQQGERCILLVRVCVGEASMAKEYDKKLRMLPERSDGRGPLSLVVAVTQNHGGAVEYPEVVVYQAAQALSQYAIWYTHASDCKCTHCWPHPVLYVKTPIGKIFTIQLDPEDPSTTVLHVKNVLFHQEGVPIGQQRLVFVGKVLEDNKPLVDYNVSRESTLHFVLLHEGKVVS